jgi:hypothetical protein
MFDAALVLLIVFETWLMPAVVTLSGSPSGGAGSNMRVLVVFRTLRLLRVLRLGRVLRSLPELLVIVRGVVIASRGVSVVLVLLGFIIYVGAVVFRVLLEGTHLGAMHFSTVPVAMGTLLIECTLSGAKGGPLLREANEEHFLFSLMLLLFVLLANVLMMGVVGGLLVQTVRAVAEAEKEESTVRAIAEAMDQVWERVIFHDSDGDGCIDEAELQELIADKEACKKLSSLGVDVEGMTNVCGFIFKQHNGRLSKPQFKRMVLELRGRELAKVKDHFETRKFLHAELELQLEKYFPKVQS